MRRSVLLVAAGLVCEGVYLVLTLRLPWWRYGGQLHSWSQLLGGGLGIFGMCLAGIGLLVAAYFWGWRLLREAEGNVRERWIVWGFSGLFAVTLFWLLPITSDLFSYLGQAHAFTDMGANPLRDPLLDLGGMDPVRDRSILAYPTFYANSPSVYGPAWTLMSAPGTMGPQDVVMGLLYLKGLAAAAYLGCVWLLKQILEKVQRSAGHGSTTVLEVLYLFAWNPLVLLMAVGDGHNDIVMMALVLLAFWLLLRESWALAFGALALSAWIKYISVILLPLFAIHVWRRAGRKRRHCLSDGFSGDGSLEPREGTDLWPSLARGGLAVMVVSILVLIPFGPVTWGTGLAERLLQPANWQKGDAHLVRGAMVGGLVVFAVVYPFLASWLALGQGALWSRPRLCSRHGQWQALGQADARALLDVSFVVSLLAFLLGAARSQPWHLVWPMALAGLSGFRWAWPTVIGLSVLMLAGQVWSEWGAPGLRLWS